MMTAPPSLEAFATKTQSRNLGSPYQTRTAGVPRVNVNPWIVVVLSADDPRIMPRVSSSQSIVVSEAPASEVSRTGVEVSVSARFPEPV